MSTIVTSTTDTREIDRLYNEYIIERNKVLAYEAEVKASERRWKKREEAMRRTLEEFGVADDILVIV